MEIAKSIVLNLGTGVLTIDGEEFGYYLADAPVKVEYSNGSGIHTIWLPVLADNVSCEPQAELPEGA